MPVTKQAIKKVRQDKRKTAINLKLKSTYKKAVSDFKKGQTAANLTKAFRALDRAAKVNVIHKNKAARLKSRLSKLIASEKKIAPFVKKTKATPEKTIKSPLKKVLKK